MMVISSEGREMEEAEEEEEEEGVGLCSGAVDDLGGDSDECVEERRRRREC